MAVIKAKFRELLVQDQAPIRLADQGVTVIMVCGVSLFLRLIRALLQPHKVRFACPACGLQRHDFDAVPCQACGQILNIPDEGTIG